MPPNVMTTLSPRPSTVACFLSTGGLSANSAATSLHDGQQNTSPR